MALAYHCLGFLSRCSGLVPTRLAPCAQLPRFLIPALSQPPACFASQNTRRSQDSAQAKREKKRKANKAYKVYDLGPMRQVSLCDAIRYLRALEAGQPPNSVKYEIAIKFRTLKSGPIIRSRIRFPYPVKSDFRIAVICKDGSVASKEARELGAIAVGESSLFAQIKEGKIDFNRLICHTDCETALNKAGVGRILGPKGLMPSRKTNTITKNVKESIQELVGAEQYREKEGVLRMAVGQLAFTPQMLADNIKVLMAAVKGRVAVLQDETTKSIYEVVLSSTHGVGFSLNGFFNPSDEKISPEMLQGSH